MNDEEITYLIEKLNTPSFSLLSDVTRLSCPTFLSPGGDKLSLTDSHYLNQQAIHRGKRRATRRAPVKNNPQLRQINQLTGKSTSASVNAEFSHNTIQSISGK